MFAKALEDARWKYTTHGLTSGQRGYEYGTLVIKNAFLVAGGGLLFVPTMVGISDKIDLSLAAIAGGLFDFAVMLSLVSNYLIHVNWMRLEEAWEAVYEIEKTQTRQAFGRGFENDAIELEECKKTLKRSGIWVKWTFWTPHILGLIYLFALCLATYFLYRSLDLVMVGSTK